MSTVGLRGVTTLYVCFWRQASINISQDLCALLYLNGYHLVYIRVAHFQSFVCNFLFENLKKKNEPAMIHEHDVSVHFA